MEPFFEIQREKSAIKSLIVSKYFYFWAKIMSEIVKKKKISNRIVYMDLFSGPGLYNDGSKSTPLLVLENIIRDQALSDLVRPVFNDKDKESIEKLQNYCNELDGVERLKFKPKFFNESIGSGMFSDWLNHRLPPTLLFADPLGYKGLSLEKFRKFLDNWGAEVIMFFNYTRINAALSNNVMKENMQILFSERSGVLSELLIGKSVMQREKIIMNEIKRFFTDQFSEVYILNFKFIDDYGTKTTHHIIHICRHPLAFKGMKEIMHDFSTEKSQGEATQLEFNPINNVSPRLFDFEKPIDNLKSELLEFYSGKEISFKKLFEDHQKKTIFIEKHYKEAIRQLESEEKIFTNPSKRARRKFKGRVSIPNYLMIKFNNK